MTAHFRSLLIALGTAASLAMAAPSAAATVQDPESPIELRVKFSDLDLAHEAGARTMMFRIGAAAKRACGGDPDPRRLERQMIYDHCKRDTVARAVVSLNSPLVTALFSGAPAPAPETKLAAAAR